MHKYMILVTEPNRVYFVVAPESKPTAIKRLYELIEMDQYKDKTLTLVEVVGELQVKPRFVDMQEIAAKWMLDHECME